MMTYYAASPTFPMYQDMSSSGLPTPPATATPPGSPDSQGTSDIVTVTYSRHVMDFIYDTGYSTCTQYCCNPERTGWKLFTPPVDPSIKNLEIPRCQRLKNRHIQPAPCTGNGCTSPVTDECIMLWVSQYSQVMPSLTPFQSESCTPKGLETWHQSYSTCKEYISFTQVRDWQLNNPKMRQQVARLWQRRHDIMCYFENSVLSFNYHWVASCFFWDDVQPGFDALSKGYLAWRSMWHMYVFRNTGEESERGIVRRNGTGLELIWNMIKPKLFGQLQLWGNLENDWNLFHYQELTSKDLRYLYEQDVDCLRYILENLKDWHVECQILNDYVGIRRDMSRGQFHKAKTEAQRAGSAMLKVMEAERRFHQSQQPQDWLTLLRKTCAARTCFLQLRYILCAEPIPTFQPPDSTPQEHSHVIGE